MGPVLFHGAPGQISKIFVSDIGVWNLWGSFVPVRTWFFRNPPGMGFMLYPPAWSHPGSSPGSWAEALGTFASVFLLPKREALPSFQAVCGFVSQGPSGCNWDSRNTNNFQNPLVALLSDAVWRLQLITGLRNIQD